jgi:hypothetical protein
MERTTNILDRIGSLIPGYTGYTKRDNQRISNKVLRNQITSRLDAVENTINDMQKNALFNVTITYHNLKKTQALEKGQFRFSLYDLSKHSTILTQINH